MDKKHSYTAPSSRTVLLQSRTALLAGSLLYGAPGYAGDYNSDNDNDYSDIDF